ncbi:MAG: DNA recombination protein RmuC [Candidatus Paceibacterota bacterium]|jgi:DNA recombination protein RmuC
MALYILIGIVFLLLGFAGAYFVMKKRTEPQQDMNSMLMLQQQVAELAKVMDAKLGESSKWMNDSLQFQMSESQKLMQNITSQVTRQLLDVQKGVTESTEQSKKVLTITEALQKLERVLTHQKQRGSLGERSLELILENVLPPGVFKLQYSFPNGEAVDAVIITKDGVIPIDAKFSLDNYQRLVEERDPIRQEEFAKVFKDDLKKRIDETAKYIRTDEGTLPFAFMFIPAEGIYYDLIVNEVGALKVNTRSLIDYATNEKKVIIVSPTTLLAYLQTVLLGYRAFKIEEATKEIGKNVQNLGKHLQAFGEFHNKLGASLSTTVNHYNSATKEFGKIDKDVLRITGEAVGVEQTLLEKPSIE